MSDDISDEMRAMIDAAVASGKVKKIPRGQSGDVVKKKNPGRPKDMHTITRVRLLAYRKMSDGEIAREIGKTRKAVSNCRYRHGIPNGFVTRRGNGVK